MGKTMKLSIYYDSETDTLSLWNGQPADEGSDVAENLTADFDSDGEVVGFTLEHAAELLKQVLTSSSKSGTATQAEGISMGRAVLEDSFHAMFLSAMGIEESADSEGISGFGHSDIFSPSGGTSVWYIASPGAIIQDEILDNPSGREIFSHMETGVRCVTIAGDINQNVIDRLLQTPKAEDSPVLLLGMPGRVS